MDVRSPLFQNIALILAGVMFLNPIAATAAQLTVDAQAGGNTSLGQAANGVPIVNIATPNGSGLSHNKFTDYNVGQQGLILNNATERLQSTQQGGIIIGNPNLGGSNLQGRAAGVILNEVTGSNRSQLKGYTEVAGQAANVIVANPHGITCDGCGFINTPRATLSTGAPVIENGQLRSFDVNGGDIAIEGAGLNASNVDQFDLITRSAKLNAELHAKRLNVITGRNDVDAATLQAIAKADDGSDKPQLAIDSSALGGMYAGAIRLVGTEAGVGVKLAGDMAASAGDIQIDANGLLTLNTAAASGQIAARAESVETQGQVYAGTQLEVQARDSLVNRGSLAARDRVALTGGARLLNEGHVEAGVNADDSRNRAGNVALAGERIRNAGSVVASHDLRVAAEGLLDNRDGQLLAEGNARIDSTQLDNHKGRIVADGNLALRSGQVDNAQGRIAAGQALGVNATGLAQQGGVLSSGAGLSVDLAGGNLDNRAGLVNAGQALRIDSAAKVDNTAGEISSRQGVQVAAASLDNQGGKLLAETSLALTGERLQNRAGRIAANADLQLVLDDIDNRGGTVSSRARVTIAAQGLDNSDQGKVIGAHLVLTTQRLLNRNQGLIHGQGNTHVAGAWLDNSGGSLSAGEDLRVELAARGELDGGLINTDGLLGSEGTLNVAAARLDNRRGDVSSVRDLNLTLLGALSNQEGRVLGDAALHLRSGDLSNDQGLISAGSTLALHAAQIANRKGRIAATGPLELTANGLQQQGGELFSKTSLALDLQGGALDNDAGFINAPGALRLDGLGVVSNRGGEISSRQGFDLAASSLDNRSGKLISEQDLRVSVSGSLDNRGGSLAGRQVEVSAAALDNGADGLLRSQGRLDVGVSGTLANQGGELLAEGDLNLLAQRLDNQKGRVAANGPLSVTAGDIDNRGGEISSRGSAGLNVTTLDNSDGGRLLAAHLNLAAARLINRDEGLIFGRDQLQLGAAHLNNSGGTLASDTRVLIELAARTGDLAHDGQLINNAGTISSEGTLNVTAATLDNSAGSLSSAGALQVTSQGALLNQQGRLLTDAGLLLRSAGLDNRHGQISAVEHLSVITGRFDNDGGRLTGNANLDLQADQIGNAQGRIAASGPLSVQASGLAQQGGELFSQTSLTLDLDGGDLNNDAGLLHAPGQLLLNNLGAVSNRGGEISSGQGFNLLATRLDNANGRLLSEQNLTLRIQGVLTNLAGLISARGIDLRAKELSNDAGTLFARGDLVIDLTGNLSNASKGLIQSAGDLRLNSGTLTNTDGTLLASKALELRSNGALDNRDGGLINSQGTLTLDAASLDSSQGGEVSAKGDLQLTLDRLTQQQGALIGESFISLDLRQGDLDNRQGLISSNGPLTLSNLRAVDNAAGEISSLGVLDLAAASLDNRNGRLISRQWLRLSLGQGDNRGGLLSGWQGLQLSGSSLDNRQRGTLSSRDGGLAVALAGALLNSGEGALVAADRLDIQAESLDNSDRGILSSGAGQRLQITRQLDNRAGQIDAGERLVIDATSVANAGGLLQAQQDLTLSSKALDNSHGRIAASGAATLNVDGTLSNAAGQLASAGPLNITTDTLNNQGGTLASQSTAKLVVSELDNSGSATLAANGALELGVAQALNNSADGLIYSRDAQVNLNAASLDNSGGAIQGQGDLLLNIGGALNNQAGTLQSRSGAVDLTAASLDNRQGTLASLEGWVRTRLSAWLRNGAIGQGGLIQGQHIDLQVAGNLDNTAGRIHALNGAATLQASAFDNQSGTLHAQGDLLLRGGDLNNQGGTLGAATITLEQATDALLDNQQGIIESRGTLHVQGGSLNNQGGQLRALGSTGTTFFTLGALLDNRGGTLETANRDLTLNLGSLLNHNGKLLHAGGGEFGVALAQVAAAGGSFVTQGGLTLKAESWSNDSILQAGHLTLDIGTFEQTANGQLLATGSLTGKGGNWINHGLIASDGPLSLTLSGAYSGNGRVTSQGALDLAAASLSLSETASITAAGAASFMLGGALLNQGRLTAADNLTLSAASVNNAGTLGSAQRLTLSTPSLINEKGLLFSGDDMALYVDTFINRYADVYSLGTLLIAGDQAGEQSSRFENVSSTVESAGDLAVNALAIINRKDAFAVSERLVSGSITYECLDCKGRHFDFYYFLNEQIERTVSSDSPASLIQAGGNLKLTGSTIENSHSTISAAGNILLVGDQVSNLGSATESVNRYRQYRNPVDSERRAVFESLISANGDIYQYNRNNAIYEHTYVIRQAREPDIYLRPDRQVTRTPNRYYNPGAQYPVPAIFSTYSLVNSVDTVTSTGVAAGAVIQAGGNVTVQSANVIENGVRRNGQSIAPGTSRAGDTSSGGSGSTTVIRLNPQLPADLAQQQVNPLSLPGFSLPTGQNGLFRLSGQSGSDSQVREAVAAQQWALAGTSLEQAQREGSGAVRIEDVRGDQSGQLQAGLGQPVAVDRPSLVIQPGTQVTVSASAAQDGAGNPVSQAQGVIVNPVARPHKYLIETNPALTELSRFLSSDYMLGQLGYDPDQAQKRLGDGLYEQRLIREAIVARTGQRYLAGLTSDEAMFRYLMNNAIASKDALNLGLGVSLSAQQVAALTHDIVWMEEQEVLGEKVLVPVLYLAQAEGRLAPNGALIQGRDVALIGGGDLSNQGTLRASGALDVQGRNIANSGLMQANERLQLLATESIRNAQGGIIAGRDVSLIAREGDIVNERSVTQHAASVGSQRWGQTHVDSAARIEASESLSLAAGRDVSNLGSVLDSRGDLAIQAGRDVTVASVQEGQYQTRGNWFVNERVTQVGAEVSAGRDLDIAAGRDLGVVASRVTAGRDLELGAERDLMLSSAADESHFLSRGKKVTQSRDQITQQSSEIQAGRDISLGAGNDLSVIASRVQAGNDVDIDAGQDIDILSAKDESASYYFKKSKGSFGRSKSRQSESYDSTNIASVIEAGNDLTINTSKAASGALNLEGGRDVTVICSQLSAGNDLLVGGTGDVAVLSGVEEHGSYAKKTKSGFLGLSKSGKSQLQTSATQVASELEAGNDVVIAAGNDIRLRASTTDAGNDVELRAGLVKETGDINLVSANDEAYSRSESYKKKFDLSASNAAGLGGITISNAKKSGQEIISSTNVGSQVNAERDASLIAERDINVVGSGVSAGRNVLLDAGRDVNVVAGSSSEQITSWKNTKTVGLQLSSDGNGVSAFAGAESLKDKTRTSEQTAAASQINAGLDLDVRAGRDIRQQGSDMQAGYDLNMKAGRDIVVDAAREQSSIEREQSQNRSGVGVTVNHNFERTKNAVSGAGKGENTVSQASSTLKAVDSVSQFLAGPTFDAHFGNTSQRQSVSQTVVGNRDSTLDAGNDINLEAGNDVQVRGAQFQSGRDINVSGRDIVLDVARGEQRYDSQQSQGKGGIVGGTSGGFKVGIGGSRGVAGEEGSQGTASGAVLNAERDVNLNARNDLNLIGTQVQAGRDIDLKAGNDLNIGAAQNASDSESSRRSGGGEIGFTFGSEGVGVYVSVNVGKGDLEREGQRQQEAYLYAGDRLNFTSGRDTAISGAQLSGDEVTGRVGRDLTVTSLPDTGKVKGREFDVSATATFGPGAGFSASVGYGQTSGSTEWVENQTRIVARDRLDIRTEEYTQIDGAVIASNTGNLKLDTGTLGFSDIAGHDKEHSYYLNVGGSYGKNDSKDTQQDKSQEGKGEKGKTGWSVEGYEYEKDRQQIVRATVGEGEIVVRGDAGTGSDSTVGLNRDVSSAYEITRDDEERTDLYVTKSSVEAVVSPIETLNQWKKDAQAYPERSLDALDDAVGLVAGVGKFAQQSWREIQAQQVSLDKVSPALRAQLGDEQALAVAKNIVRNGLNSDVINNFGENDLIVLAKFAEVYGDFNYEQAKCQASGGCRSPSTGLGSQSTNVVNEYGEKVPRSDDTVPLTAGEKLLLQSYKLNKYVSGLELEQAQLLMLGVQALMGPAKAAVGLAGNQLIASLFGDQIEKVKGDLALKIADQLLPAQLEDLAREHQKNKERHAAGEEVNDGVAFVIGSEFLLDVAMGSVGGFGRKAEGKVVVGRTSSDVSPARTITQTQAQKEVDYPLPDKPVKDLSKDSSKPVKDASKDPSIAVPKMDELTVKAFNPYNSDKFNAMSPEQQKSFIKEYNKQLQSQQDAINRMTVDDFKSARDAYEKVGRNPDAVAAQQKFGKDFENSVRESITESLMAKGKDFKTASAEAAIRAKKIRSDLAALHDPDMVAGGWFSPEPVRMGDSLVNSSIGGSWPSRLKALDEQVSKAIANGYGQAQMNIRLELLRGAEK